MARVWGYLLRSWRGAWHDPVFRVWLLIFLVANVLNLAGALVGPLMGVHEDLPAYLWLSRTYPAFVGASVKLLSWPPVALFPATNYGINPRWARFLMGFVAVTAACVLVLNFFTITV